ncbi:MAG: protein translocase subunit SecF [Patescibacteria group bacterium]
MSIISHYKKFFIFSGLLSVASIVSLGLWQLNFGIDFTGGSLMEIEFENIELKANDIKDSLADLALENLSVQPVGETGFILRFKDVDEETHQKILGKIKEKVGVNDGADTENFDSSKDIAESGLVITPIDGGDKIPGNIEAEVQSSSENVKSEIASVRETRFESIGPVIGKELQRRALWAIILVVISIIVYVAWAFRGVSKPISSWKYGIVAIVALIHDVLIVVGIFSFLGRFYGVEVSLSFVAAILTILGYSVNDTIVVFDRVRENLTKDYGSKDFSVIVDNSLNQTIVRSINTGSCALLVLVIIFIFGGLSVIDLVLALIFGIIFGTYSSIFIASPLLVEWNKWTNRNN